MGKFLFAVVASIAAVVASQSGVNAAFIPGLYTTGVDNFNTVLAGGANDPHYSVVNPLSPLPPTTVGPAVVLTSIPSTYISNNSTSKWVWQNADGQPTNVTRTFRTTFSLAGLNAATATISGSWATDNQGLNILLNGVATGITSSGFTSPTLFTINAGSPFVSGVNTLDFVVQDFGVVSGFRVGSLTGTAALIDPNAVATPLPATALMAVVGFPLLGLAGAARRRLFA